MNIEKIIKNLEIMDKECDNCKYCKNCKYRDECFKLEGNSLIPLKLLFEIEIKNNIDKYIENLKYIESLDL